MWRLSNFEITRLPSPDDVYVFDCVARTNRSDERLVAVAEIRDITPVRGDDGRVLSLPGVETVLINCLDGIRQALASRADGGRLEWNRVMLYIWPVVDFSVDEMREIARRLTPLTEGLGLEQVVVSGRLLVPGTYEPVDAVLRLGYEAGKGLTVRFTEPPTAPMRPLDDYTRKLMQTRRRGLVYPYELVPVLAGPGGSFVEHDLDDAGALVPVDARPGPEPGRRGGRGRAHADDAVPHRRRHGRDHQGRRCSEIPPRRWARSPRPSAGVCWRRSTWRRRWTCRSSGSRCRPGRGSPWTPAARTSTGWPACSVASSSTRKPAAGRAVRGAVR